MSVIGDAAHHRHTERAKHRRGRQPEANIRARALRDFQGRWRGPGGETGGAVGVPVPRQSTPPRQLARSSAVV